jgi:hypothetical protein
LLNNLGQLVWVGPVAGLHLYDGVNHFIDNCDYPRYPGLNDRGQIAYNNYSDELWLYDHRTGSKVQMEGHRHTRYNIQINDRGQILWWQMYGSPDLIHMPLYLATPECAVSPMLSLLLD